MVEEISVSDVFAIIIGAHWLAGRCCVCLVGGGSRYDFVCAF